MIRLVQNIHCVTSRKSYDDRAVKNLCLAKGADNFHNDFCQQVSQGSSGLLANRIFIFLTSHVLYFFVQARGAVLHSPLRGVLRCHEL
jgi:hypothetical protein